MRSYNRRRHCHASPLVRFHPLSAYLPVSLLARILWELGDLQPKLLSAGFLQQVISERFDCKCFSPLEPECTRPDRYRRALRCRQASRKCTPGCHPWAIERYKNHCLSSLLKHTRLLASQLQPPFTLLHRINIHTMSSSTNNNSITGSSQVLGSPSTNSSRAPPARNGNFPHRLSFHSLTLRRNHQWPSRVSLKPSSYQPHFSKRASPWQLLLYRTPVSEW